LVFIHSHAGTDEVVVSSTEQTREALAAAAAADKARSRALAKGRSSAGSGGGGGGAELGRHFLSRWDLFASPGRGGAAANPSPVIVDKIMIAKGQPPSSLVWCARNELLFAGSFNAVRGMG